MANTIDDIRNNIDEALTLQQRMKRKQSFRRHKAKIKRGQERAKRKLAPKDKLERRAAKQARQSIEKKLLGGKVKKDLPLAQRKNIEAKVEKREKVIKRIARKLFPQVKRDELTRLKDFRKGGSR